MISMPFIYKATGFIITMDITTVGMMAVRESCEITTDTLSEVVLHIGDLLRYVTPRPSCLRKNRQNNWGNSWQSADRVARDARTGQVSQLLALNLSLRSARRLGNL